MKLTSFSIRGEDLVGFGESDTGRKYNMYFDIKTFSHYWEKEGISIDDLVKGKAYCITSVRNRLGGKPTKWIKNK